MPVSSRRNIQRYVVVARARAASRDCMTVLDSVLRRGEAHGMSAAAGPLGRT
jgi:hypothetical protein